jgi:hypothetical protein
MKRDNIVEIATRFTEAPPIEVRQRQYDDCQHEHTIIDEKLRIVSCVDCREERLDPMEVLIHLARVWRRWRNEADELRKLRTEYREIEREKWERARDRHLGANPSHIASFDATRRSWSRDGCRICSSLEVRWNSRWEVTRAPEPPPGPLEPVVS